MDRKTRTKGEKMHALRVVGERGRQGRADSGGDGHFKRGKIQTRARVSDEARRHRHAPEGVLAAGADGGKVENPRRITAEVRAGALVGPTVAHRVACGRASVIWRAIRST